MADEAFALSPINARAAQPTDADYDAICSAFMETTRGRWFLDEYTRRNRNADTRLVLDAVARLEANLETQRQAQAAQATRPAADLWPELAKLLATARIEIAQHLLREGQDAGLETIQAGAETIRSVSWALRERGFDSRICDAFDAQVGRLLEGRAALAAAVSASAGSSTHVLAAVDHLIESARGLLTDQTGQRNDETLLDEMVDAVAGAMADDTAFDESGTFDSDDIEPPRDADLDDAVPHAAAPEGFIEIRGGDADLDIVDLPIPQPPPAPVLSEPEINRQRLYEAKVEPYAAPATDSAVTASLPEAEISSEAETFSRAEAFAGDSPQPVDDASIDNALVNKAMVENALVENALVDTATVDKAPVDNAFDNNALPAPSERTMSLGHAVLASGAIARPGSARPDPLAPFRRMSQAEKIAFFS